MKTIVALVDFSDTTPKVLEAARSLAMTCGCHLSLVHVVPTGPVVVDFAPPPPPSASAFLEKQRDLLALRDALAAQDVNVTAQTFEGALMETVLLQLRRLDPDLIVMGSHGHGALYNLLIGSVTEEVLKQVAWPVLVVPAMTAPKTASPMKKTEKTGYLMGVLGGPPAPL